MSKVKLIFFAWLVSGAFTAYVMAGFPIPGCEFEADNTLGYVAECPFELVDPRLNPSNYPVTEDPPGIVLVMTLPIVAIVFWLISSMASWFIYPVIAALLIWPEFRGRAYRLMQRMMPTK